MMECSPYALAASLLANLQANLADTRAGVTERSAVYPHADPSIEWCSMAWVGVGKIQPANQQRGSCRVLSWTASLTVGVQRCYPTMTDGSAPPEDAVDSAARDVLDDFEAMWRAVVAAFGDPGINHLVTGWRTVGEQGGSHGSRMTVDVEVAGGVFVEPRSPKLPGDPRTS